MPRPNSLLTRLRVAIVRAIDPFPEVGEGWCTGCTLNDGRTTVISASAVTLHMEKHYEVNGPYDYVKIKTRTPISELLS